MSIAKVSVTIAATLVALAIGATVIVGSGIYNIGADDQHAKIVLAIIVQLRERSIAVRAQPLEVPDLHVRLRILAGAERYAALCVGCHLAPGVTKSDIRRGLYPHPPNLAQQDPGEPRRTFWAIKHGIKMSAMPAWGKTLDDGQIWDLVAFLQKMPTLSPEAYRLLRLKPAS